jgi:hypothetical protein
MMQQAGDIKRLEHHRICGIMLSGIQRLTRFSGTTEGGTDMRTAAVGLLATLTLLVSMVTLAQPPDHFELFQNFPDPFCVLETGGVTEIRFMTPMSSRVLLEVWSPDTTVVLRTLNDGFLHPGYYTYIWDGRDGVGEILPEGLYPYSMTATDTDTGDSLYYDMLVATIECPQVLRATTFGRVKEAFGE